jgi:hypothetical protein
VNTLGWPAWVRLSYTLTASGEEIDYRVPLTATRPRFGGLRWWFACPLIVGGRPCGRRSGKLYLRGRYFGCRRCHDLTYTSCRESHTYDGVIRLLAADTGLDFDTAKRAVSRWSRRKWTGPRPPLPSPAGAADDGTAGSRHAPAEIAARGRSRAWLEARRPSSTCSERPGRPAGAAPVRAA